MYTNKIPSQINLQHVSHMRNENTCTGGNKLKRQSNLYCDSSR